LESIVNYLLKENKATISYLAEISLTNEFLVKKLIEDLRGINIEDGIVSVENRLELAISAIHKGISPYVVSRYLSWKDFEKELSEILEQYGYEVLRNYRIRKPSRAEIDIVAIKTGLALIVDCKHWSPRSASRGRIEFAANKQVERTKLLLENEEFLLLLGNKACIRRPCEVKLVPVLVTLVSKNYGLLNSVPVVPIKSFLNFLIEIDKLLELIIRISVKIE
jgi:Holliday junction resolvase-like predicted endonuclease